jgi:hypothetical protein
MISILPAPAHLVEIERFLSENLTLLSLMAPLPFAASCRPHLARNAARTSA